MLPKNGLKSVKTEVAEDAFTCTPHRGVKRPQRNHVARNGRTDGVEVERPHTRGKYAQSGPNTRSRSRSSELKQVSGRLNLLCSTCWNPAGHLSTAQTTIKVKKESEHKVNRRRKGSAPRAACPRPRRGARAHVHTERGARALSSSEGSPETYRLKLDLTKTSSIGGDVDDLVIDSIGRKVKPDRSGRFRSLRAAWCQPQVATADPARVLKRKQIHLTGIPNIDGHGSMINSELIDMDTRGHGEVIEKPPNSPAGSPRHGLGENMAIQEETTDPSDSEPEDAGFSCQRARVHLKEMYWSCARTYMPWPFSNGGPKISTPLSSPSVGESATTSTLLISEPEDGGLLPAMPCFLPLAFANPNKDAPSPNSLVSSHGHEVRAADDSPWHDEEKDMDSSSSTHSSTLSQNYETFSPCNSNIMTSEKQDTREVLLHSVLVEPWSKIYMDPSLPRPLLSPLSSPTKPSYTRLLPNHRSQETKVSVASSLDFRTDVLDEITAYENDILLVEVVQDDPDLFDNLPKQSMLKPGPALQGSPKIPPGGFMSRAGRALFEAKKRVTSAPVQFYVRSLFADPIEEESDSRPWRAERSTPSPMASNSWPTTNPVVGPTTNPVVGPTTNPVVGPTTNPVVGPTTNPVVGPTTNPVVGPTTNPVVGPTTNPVVGPTTNPVVGPTTNPVVGPTTNPVVGQNKFDANNNQTGDTSDWPLTIQANKPLFNLFGSKDCDNGVAQPAGHRLKIREDLRVLKQHPSTTYCKFYFSEKQSCYYKFCRFPHSPVNGDEKFCMETVLRFTKNQLCLQKASTVFVEYYQKNSPGVFFSHHVMTCLLWSLLKAGRFTSILSVLNRVVAHQIPPVPEFLLELFNVVREQDLNAILPELTRITSQISMSALPASMDNAQMSPDIHGNTLLVTAGMFSPPLTTTTPSNGFPESLDLANTLVEVELCIKLENWPRLGSVFRRVCQSGLRPLDLEQLSGRITVALLSEASGKLAIPFAVFTDMVSQEGIDDLMKTTLGRIGVSLMLRYYKTHQWEKGRRVVEILSSIQVAFSTLKVFFCNKRAVSRCSLITVASKLFLRSGSIEGALNTLRDNEWFLASCSWPCRPEDLEERTHLLLRLAESTAQRDALEILSNLPGLKEPNESVDISQYGAVFNAHLQECMAKRMLPMASDVAELMLCKQLEVQAGLLQTLLSKLGKQSPWHRAREIFVRALNAGYYPEVAASRGLQSLCVPPTLGEMEMALCLEMLMSTNLSLELQPAVLCITVQRSVTCERVYLSASNRLLSAAAVLQPRLTLHYTANNSSQEHEFTLDTPSARTWLKQNRSWASGMWSRLS
ncbi:uncharacterized protein topaz1 isoform X2 [Gadus macrocephalus]|uniref:uncharacterized protein topaz1 isoform X2 n=1 Tax=Gadus macrocephalus TaxID=80720 RepID=UPI0028CBC101|nr:uncharacterized protein topaz1 isoform X2 [Gadus macrocephalus]